MPPRTTTVTFYKAGTYVFTATIADAGKLTVSSSVTVLVNQTFTSILVYPGNQITYPKLNTTIKRYGVRPVQLPDGRTTDIQLVV